jgi:hypothetical protein
MKSKIVSAPTFQPGQVTSEMDSSDYTQNIKGFIKLPRFFVENHMKRLSLIQIRSYLFILSKPVGFNKNEDEISISQFIDSINELRN